MKPIIIVFLLISLSGCAIIQQQQAAEARKKYMEAVREAKQGAIECSQMFKDKELKNHTEAALCMNDRITQAYERVDFPRMDVVNLINAKRLEVAEKVDHHRLTVAQARLELSAFVAEIRKQQQAEQAMARQEAERHQEAMQGVYMQMISTGLSMTQR